MLTTTTKKYLNTLSWICAGLFLTVSCIQKQQEGEEEGWLELFNGKDLTGWRVSETPESWSVQEGFLTGVGERAHLFYEGEALQDGFTDFELIAEVMTGEHANSGIYFHTEYQEENWPAKGSEVQVNNTHVGIHGYVEFKKTGSLYGVRNTYKAYAKDNEWFTMKIKVVGNHVRVWVNEVNTIDYLIPENRTTNNESQKQQPSSGTFALQCHDPGSMVKYRSVKVRRLEASQAQMAPGEISGAWKDRMQGLQNKGFPFVDLDPQPDTPPGIETLVKYYYHTGINMASLSKASELDDLPTLSAKLESWKNLPLFFGIKVSSRDLNKIKEENVQLFDYVIGEVAVDSPGN
ncbi:MAG: DUF1080 domain-containing protein, partial [Cyclobacteriaceae bacterium]|nr:DUF1080 domain-containing protein [Cyclobacteriaceae bacterium]